MAENLSTVAARASIESSPLYNPDLAPVSSERRTWSTYNYAALWVSMSVNILTYVLAASLIQGGMNWKQAVLTVFLGNSIVLAPMLLNSHPGARVMEFPSRCWPEHPLACWARTWRLCCGHWWPAAGSEFKAGLAARPSTRC